MSHKLLNLRNGHIQLPEHQNGFQHKALLIGVVAVAVPLHHCRGEQTNLVVPHKGFLVDAVQGCKLPDGKQPIVLGHFFIFPLDYTVTV